MKTLVAFYSRSGITKKVAEAIQAGLGCGIEEIIDLKNRSGIFGFLSAGYSATTKKLTDIKKPEKDPSTYELIIIGTPIWAGSMTPAIRTYVNWLKSTGALSKLKTAFLCTGGSANSDKVLAFMVELVGKESVATLGVRRDDVDSSDQKIKSFVAATQG